MRSSVSPVPSCPCLLAPNASSVPPTVTAMLWSPPAAMAVTRAGGLSLVGSSDWMAWGTGMAMGCGLGACTGGRWRGQARGRGVNAGFGQRLREKAASRKCARPSQSSWWQLSKPGATSGHNCACRKALSLTNHPQPPRMHTCTSATSCWWPSCPNLASPHVKILPSAASAMECARPAAADTMRSPLQPGATRGACEERKLFERRWAVHRKKRAGDDSSSRYFSGLCGCSRPAACSAPLHPTKLLTPAAPLRRPHLMASTSVSTPSSWKWPCPSWPCRPRPQDQSCPASLMASVWLAPAHTLTTRVRMSEVIILGTDTSMGVHPPWPSSPELARPHVYSSPLRKGGGQGEQKWVRAGESTARSVTACQAFLAQAAASLAMQLPHSTRSAAGAQWASTPPPHLPHPPQAHTPTASTWPALQPPGQAPPPSPATHLREMEAVWLLPALTTASWMSSGWPW